MWWVPEWIIAIYRFTAAAAWSIATGFIMWHSFKNKIDYFHEWLLLLIFTIITCIICYIVVQMVVDFMVRMGRGWGWW